jgi:hypothetical protein
VAAIPALVSTHAREREHPGVVVATQGATWLQQTTAVLVWSENDGAGDLPDLVEHAFYVRIDPRGV